MESAGTRRLLAQLYDGHGRRLYRYALVLLGREKDAEDVVQNVFARLAGQDGQPYLLLAPRQERANVPEMFDRGAVCRRRSGRPERSEPGGIDLERRLRWSAEHD